MVGELGSPKARDAVKSKQRFREAGKQLTMRQESPTMEADVETPPVVELVNKDINIAVKKYICWRS